MLSYAVWMFFEIVLIILIVYCLLTWIPGINWNQEPFKTLRGFCDLFFAPFRRLIPPIRSIDISPIIAFILLSLMAKTIVYVLSVLHL